MARRKSIYSQPAQSADRLRLHWAAGQSAGGHLWRSTSFRFQCRHERRPGIARHVARCGWIQGTVSPSDSFPTLLFVFRPSRFPHRLVEFRESARYPDSSDRAWRLFRKLLSTPVLQNRRLIPRAALQSSSFSGWKGYPSRPSPRCFMRARERAGGSSRRYGWHRIFRCLAILPDPAGVRAFTTPSIRICCLRCWHSPRSCCAFTVSCRLRSSGPTTLAWIGCWAMALNMETDSATRIWAGPASAGPDHAASALASPRGINAFTMSETPKTISTVLIISKLS